MPLPGMKFQFHPDTADLSFDLLISNQESFLELLHSLLSSEFREQRSGRSSDEF